MIKYKIMKIMIQSWTPREAIKMFEHYEAMEKVWATKDNYIESMVLINDQGEIINEYKRLSKKTMH